MKWTFAAAVLAILLFLSLRMFLLWEHQMRHNQSGVGLNSLKNDVFAYAHDHNGRLPPMTNYAAFRQAILPYAGSNAAFREYDTQTGLYLPNPCLSGKKVSAIKQVTVLLYESEPLPSDGTRWVAFVPDSPGPAPIADPDFTGLRLVKEADWQRLKASNRLP